MRVPRSTPNIAIIMEFGLLEVKVKIMEQNRIPKNSSDGRERRDHG